MSADAGTPSLRPPRRASDHPVPGATYSKPYQAPTVRLANRCRRSATRLVGPPPRLDPDVLVAAARKRSRLHDLGDPAFAQPLRVLVEAYEREAGLHPVGRSLTRMMLVRSLARRLQIVEAVRRDPVLADAPVARPLIVVGLPRTGTTLLYNLLACNAFARPLRGWEGFDPVAAPTPGSRGTDPRPRRYRRQVRLIDHLAPSVREVHELGVDRPEEDLTLLQRTFVSHGFVMMANVPSYEEWLWRQPQATFAAAYAFHRVQLQLLQAQHPPRLGGHWLLKSPAHLYGLEGLLRTYPNACLVHTHRGLEEVLPSTCSLFAVVRSIASDRVDAAALGRQAVAWGHRLVARLLELRARLPAQRFLDVRYDQLIDDPISTLERVHEHFGLPMDGGAPTRARAHLAARPSHRHGRHRYSLDQFGITAEEIARFGRTYQERFMADTRG